MPTKVVMPQMGESIAEGTIVRWIKKVGETVDRDEPLFEISTDKVDAEIPSPAAGVVLDIKAQEGETVPVESVVALIGAPGEAAETPAAESTREAAPTPPGRAERPREPAAVPASGRAAAAPAPVEPAPAAVEPAFRLAGEASKEQLRRTRSSPLVRRIAREHDVDISQLAGTGIGGRVTRQDILGHVEARKGAPAAAPEPARVPAFTAGEPVEVVPMSVMRRKIAEHMILSRRTSAHVHSVFDVDFTRVARLREAHKAEYARAGVKLTYLAFIAKATVDALRAMPIVNASLDGTNIVYKKEITLGIAVALDWGLIVPVIRRADEKNLIGLSRAIADLAERARAKQLKPEEVQGGTFTITNPGTFGTLFGMPIINQPQLAILGVGAIEKRPVIIDDAIAIRWRAYLTLGYDHRLIDGAAADQFMARIKAQIESFEEAAL